VPDGIPAGTPVQAHVADGDRFAPPDQIAALWASAEHAGAEVSLHTYPGAGHFYSDPSLPDYDPVATDRTWRQVDGLLETARRHISS
jgi:dienelactone hydrolase